jgi:hypothetical protein
MGDLVDGGVEGDVVLKPAERNLHRKEARSEKRGASSSPADTFEAVDVALQQPGHLLQVRLERSGIGVSEIVSA